MTPLSAYLVLAAMLFAIGLAGALTRRNAIIVLIGIMFVIFSIGVAAAEAAVGLALIIAIYRHYKTTNLDQIDSMKG